MKKTIISLIALTTVTSAFALPKIVSVKNGQMAKRILSKGALPGTLEVKINDFGSRFDSDDVDFDFIKLTASTGTYTSREEAKAALQEQAASALSGGYSGKLARDVDWSCKKANKESNYNSFQNKMQFVQALVEEGYTSTKQYTIHEGLNSNFEETYRGSFEVVIPCKWTEK